MHVRRGLWSTLVVALAVMAFCAPAQAAFNDQPAIAGEQAVDVTTTSATFKAAVTFNERAAEWWFTYCRESDCANGVTETPHQFTDIPDDAAALTPQPIQWSVSDLVPANVYRVTVHAQSDSWNDNDANLAKNAATKDFTFQSAAPVIPPVPVATSAQTQQPTGVTPYAATLNGSAVPGTTGSTSDGASAFFEWGPQGGALTNATPQRRLPSDSQAYPVSASISDLMPGSRLQYRLVVVRGGQRFEGKIVAFQSSSAPNCAAGATYQTVRLDRVVAVGCFRAAGQRWVAESFVRLNGLLLEPQGTARGGNNHRLTCDTAACGALQGYLDSGNKLYIDRVGDAIGTTGPWKMSADGLPGMYHGTLRVDHVAWGGTDPLLSVGADRTVDLIGFPLAGQLTLTPSSDGTTRLGMLVSLPVALGGITGEAGVKVNPGGDLAFDRLRIEVGEVPVKGFSLGGLVFEYDRSADLWHGKAELTIPSPSKVTIGAEVTVIGGRFNEFSGSVDNLNVQIAYGIYLQKVSATVGIDPIRLGGGLGLSAGPTLAGVQVLRVDGTFLLNAQSRYDATRQEWLPPSLALGGSVSIFSIPVREASAEFFFTNQAWIEMQGRVGIDVKSGDFTIFSLGGNVAGALRGRTFEVAGTMGLTVLDYDVGSATAILNTKGVAACGQVLGGLFAVGGYGTWSGHTGTVWYCDMDRLRGELNAAAAARSAQSAPHALELPAGDRQALVRFSGRDAAPQVRLHGPGGRVIETPAPGAGRSASQAGSFLALRDDHAKQTDVMLARTGSGHWTYEVLSGSAGAVTVQSARPLPKPSVIATVRRRGGGSELRWRLRAIPGQRVTFMEEGRGAPPRVIATTRAAHGHVRFSPIVTLQRRRTILAIVEQDGRARRRLTVAHYTAPALGRVTRVRSLRAKRRGKTVTVSWSKMAAARSFQIVVTETTGKRMLHTVTRPRYVLHGVDARRTVGVSVRAVGYDAKVGAAATARVKR
jgi:hypothetical protein